jgi:hypothetical protein
VIIRNELPKRARHEQFELTPAPCAPALLPPQRINECLVGLLQQAPGSTSCAMCWHMPERARRLVSAFIATAFAQETPEAASEGDSTYAALGEYARA